MRYNSASLTHCLSVCLSVCLYYLSSLFSSSSHPLVAFFITFQSLSRRRKIVIFDNMLNQRRSATFIRLRWLYGYKLKSKTRDGIFFPICDFHRNNALMLSRVISSYMRRASTFSLFPALTSPLHNYLYFPLPYSLSRISSSN